MPVMSTTRNALAFALAILLMVASNVSHAQNPSAPTGPIIVTVGGLVQNSNRDAYNPGRDRFFEHTNIKFDKAFGFDYAALAQLPQQSVQARTKAGDVVFAGPLLRDVLSIAGAASDAKTVQFKALDQFTGEITLESAMTDGWIVALTENGKPFTIGDYGPTRIARQLPQGQQRGKDETGKWVYSMFYIDVR